MICDCTAALALPTIPKLTCGKSFGQIQKIAFQRLTANSGSVNEFVETGSSANSIKLKASWTAFINDTGSEALGTNIVFTPFVEAPTQDGGDEITYGGGNDTLGGIEKIVGRNPTTFTFALREYPQSIIAELKKLMCEKNLGVYLFNAEGEIEAIKKEVAGTGSTTVVHYSPIPIRSLFVGDKIHGGFSDPDSNALKFALNPNYSDNLDSVVPTDFNPLIEW